MLRDKFVIGLANSTTQQHLLTEDNLTFQAAVDFAMAREAAIRDVQAAHTSIPNNNEVNKVNNPSTKPKNFKPNNKTNKHIKFQITQNYLRNFLPYFLKE